jgi:hypothetical protein
MKKILYPLLLIFTLALTACGGTDTVVETETTSSSALSTDYENALPIQLQLSVGTFCLEGTDLAVDAEQAVEIIPLWQVLNGLTESGSAAPEEIDALVVQIEETMTSEQIETIAFMQLTRENMGEIMQEYGLAPNGETPPEGFVPGQGRGGSDVPGLSGGGGRNTTGMTPEQIETARAERKGSEEAGSMMNSRISHIIIEGLIELLQSK